MHLSIVNRGEPFSLLTMINHSRSGADESDHATPTLRENRLKNKSVYENIVELHVPSHGLLSLRRRSNQKAFLDFHLNYHLKPYLRER